MAHYARLVGCASREIAATYDLTQVTEAAEPQLVARYMIPLLWLACFDPADALTIRERDPASVGEGASFVVLCAPVGDVIHRLRRRQASVLGLIEPSFAPLYTDWITFLDRHFAHQLLLQTEDLFAMDGYDRAGLRLQAALRFMAVADTGRRIKERAAIDWFAALPDAFAQRQRGERNADAGLRWRAHLSGTTDVGDSSAAWPVRPSAMEIAFAGTRPEAALDVKPGTAAAEQETLTQRVRHGVFADSVSGGLRLAAGKLAGNVPLGINAPTKPLRKLIGGGSELLELLRYAALGLILALIGALLLWVSLSGEPDWKMLGIGAALLGISVWPLRGARTALRNLRAITRA
jgi:hypothetical protein